MKLSNVDSSIFQVLEGYKAEINHLAKTNFDHIEECTGDSILVDPVLLDGLKTSTNVVVKKVEKLLETLNRNEPDKDRQNFILNSYSTDYIIN
ncbi:MAG: hypothetical protein H7329_08615 [Opitutaceae bacterium]|nr:hypothetical protein [Cytophagales bacterium]